MTIPLETPVLIIGGGPIGLALAGDLGRRGVASVLIERQDGTDILQPKMDLLHARIMEIVRRWGLKGQGSFRRFQPRPFAGLCVGHRADRRLGIGPRALPTNAASPPEPQSPEHKER